MLKVKHTSYPSGIHLDGTLEIETFRADVTLTMSALKLGMFSDGSRALNPRIYYGEVKRIVFPETV